MKPTVISAEALFEDLRASLHWEWIAGHAHPERHFDEAAIREAESAADLVGYLNYIHPYRVQIVGAREARYLSHAADDDQERRIGGLILEVKGDFCRKVRSILELKGMLKPVRTKKRKVAIADMNIGRR